MTAEPTTHESIAASHVVITDDGAVRIDDAPFPYDTAIGMKPIVTPDYGNMTATVSRGRDNQGRWVPTPHEDGYAFAGVVWVPVVAMDSVTVERRSADDCRSAEYIERNTRQRK